MQDGDVPVAETRSALAAKLKRAASLPRMTNGRRPPMVHANGISTEGEERPREGEPPSDEPDSDVVLAPLQIEEQKPEPVFTPEPQPIIEPSARKRRSRSRTRSRGSRDYKQKQAQANESSPEAPPSPLPASPPPVLISPTPSRIPARLLISPAFVSPRAFSPSPNTPKTPMPTLDDIRSALIRSNSAGGRITPRLTEPGSSSSTPPPLPGLLGRNNTVSGGERSAASKNMLKRLQARVKEGDTEGEETVVTPTKPKRARSRPRSRRASAKAANAATDAESGFTSTPAAPSTPIPLPSRPTSPLDPESIANGREDAMAKLMGVRRRRSVVVEENYYNTEVSTVDANGLPATPVRPIPSVANARIPHSSDAPSNGSTDSPPGSAVPLVFSTSQTTERFPSTPTITPNKTEIATPPVEQLPRPKYLDDLDGSREEDEEEEEEEFVYSSARQRQYDAFDREISWIAEPVPERESTLSWVNEPEYSPIEEDATRSPIHDEDDEVDQSMEQPDPPFEEEPSSATSSKDYSQPAAFVDDTSRRGSSNYDDEDEEEHQAVNRNILVESETSPDLGPTNFLSSPSLNRESEDSSSPSGYPTRLSVASPVQDSDWDESRATPSGERDNVWGKLKKLARTGSTSGTRSRTNSLIARERSQQNTDSSISRESGASAKGDIFSTFTQQQQASSSQPQSPFLQSPSASASILSLAPHHMLSGGASPLPAASPADAKYQNSKLFPFPGMLKLEEQRKRGLASSASASTPDVSLSPQAHDADPWLSHSSSSNTPAATPETAGRGRKLSHQASDTRLLDKFQSPTSAAFSSPHYFDLTPRSPSATLPRSLKGVRRWMQAAKSAANKSPASPALPSPAPISPAVMDIRAPQAVKKPSMSDLLRLKQEGEWQEVVIESASTPTITSSANTFLDPIREKTPNTNYPRPEENTPKGKSNLPAPLRMYERYQQPYLSPSLGSPPEPPSSATPDPLSSIDDYPAHSTSESSSSTSSSDYAHHNYALMMGASQGVDVLERLDEMMRSKMTEWTDIIDNPPRKLLISSPVLQVVNANTVKDRFLFLFTDLLVIAKPIIQDQENLMDHSKPNPMDRKYIVKSVVLLRDLRFNPDRDEPAVRTSNYAVAPRHPLVSSFVQQFNKDPSQAVLTFVQESGTREAHGAVGRLLFKTLDIDRTRLGEYLSRRATRADAKAYIDSFGFTGVRVDCALRVFLHSISLPPTESESLLDLFAVRWYEANASIVAYDKDLAVRLVRACLQLNLQMHGGIAQEPGPTGYPKRNITSRDFLDAFRRLDARGIISDESLDNVYTSIRRERLSQARSNGSTGDLAITIKRALPPRVTYRVQSEPIMLRIPQPDSQLTIELFGQDLVFDPPTLTFAKSTEASFRVTGTSLGTKTIFMHRSGPNALKYTGMPLSSPVAVERAFMRNTFQIAFPNRASTMRRYMFSVDDPLIRHQWTVSLRREIDACTINPLGPHSAGTSKFHRAAEAVAFQVLQETLIGQERDPAPSAIDKALQNLASSSTPSNSYFGRNVAAHVRSKSRSQVYHRHGAGKHELELSQGESSSTPDQLASTRADEKLWSGKDLEMQCSHNGSIALVLAHLQIGGP